VRVADDDVDASWVPTVDELVALLTRPTSGRRGRHAEVDRAVLDGDGTCTVQSDVAAALAELGPAKPERSSRV
jgi:hypothetical protein